MRIEEITTLDGLLAYRKEWNDLLERSSTRMIFLTPEWVITWWRELGEDDSFMGEKKLRTVLIWEGSNLVGVAPLMVRKVKRFGLTLRLLEFVGCGMGDYSDFLLAGNKEQLLNQLWGYLVNCDDWDIGKLENFSSFDDHPLLLEKLLLSHQVRLQIYPADLCPHVRIEGPWETFFEETLKQRTHGGHRKKELRRLERRLTERGKVSYRLIHGLKEDPNFLEKMAAVQRVGARSKNLFDRPAYRRFLERFVTETVDRDWIRVSTLEVDGEWIAYYFGFHYANRYSLYNTSFRRNFANCSPGSLLLFHILKCSFEEGLAEVDFMRGEEDFKFNWSNGSRRNTRLVFHRNNFMSRLSHGLYTNLWPLLKRLGRPTAALSFSTKSNDEFWAIQEKENHDAGT